MENPLKMSFTESTHLKHSKTDVLVVGAGPSGLMAAQALGRLGIDVTVVERRYVSQTRRNTWSNLMLMLEVSEKRTVTQMDSSLDRWKYGKRMEC